jgi:hypothetical protein
MSLTVSVNKDQFPSTASTNCSLQIYGYLIFVIVYCITGVLNLVLANTTVLF